MKTVFAAAIAAFAIGGIANAQEAPGLDGMTHHNSAAVATSGIDYTRTQSIGTSTQQSSANATFRWDENR